MKALPQGREWDLLFQHKDTVVSLPLPNPAKPPPSEETPRILIADDDPIVRGSLAAVLESENYIVKEARNGIEAVTEAIQTCARTGPARYQHAALGRMDGLQPTRTSDSPAAGDRNHGRPNQYEKAVGLGGCVHGEAAEHCLADPRHQTPDKRRGKPAHATHYQPGIHHGVARGERVDGQAPPPPAPQK